MRQGKKAPGKAVDVRVVRLAHGEGLPLPSYQTAGAAGLDLLAALPADAPQILKPGGRALVPTGLQIALPASFEAQVRPRSGLAVKHGVTVLNSPGTIDCDYRGEVQVLLVNLGDEPFTVRRGERIAQLIIAPVSTAKLAEVARLEGTERGSGGFGSTGVASVAGSRRAAPGGRAKSKAVPRPSAAKKRRPPGPGRRPRK